MGAAAKPKPNVVPMRALTDKEAQAWLVQRGRIETSASQLARDWRWSSKKVKTHLDRWAAAGAIEVKPGLGGRTVITAIAEAPAPSDDDGAPAVSAPVALHSHDPANHDPVADALAVMRASVAAAADPASRDDEPADAGDEQEEPEEPAPAAGEPGAAASGLAETAPVAPAPPEASAADLVARLATPAASIFAPKPRVSLTTPALTTALLPEPPGSTPSVSTPSSLREISAIVAKRAAEPATAPAPASTVPLPPPVLFAGSATASPHPRGSGFVNALAYLVAVALAGIAAFFSISGMIVLFPGAPTAIVTMGVVMESAKLVTVAFLAHQWRTLAWLSRIVLIFLVAGLAAINAAGVYSQLVAAHFGDRASAEQTVETETATLAAKTEVQAQTVADIDRRIAQIDAAIAEMTKRGRATGALDAIAAQRKQRDALVGQRREEADRLAMLKSDAAAVAARNHRIEIEAAPIMYVAQMMGASTEQAIRMLILLMVLTCDPLAVALTAAASRPRWKG